MSTLRSRAAAFLLAFVGFTSPTWAGRPLSFEDRVRAQEAIERVYYAHRIWPKENPGPKSPFEGLMPKAQIEAKVTDYLKKSAALGELWQRPLTAEQLQAEMDRMVARTKDPETLKELFVALGNDPYLVAECLARPILADRLARNWYAFDSRFHGALKAEAEALRERLTPQNFRELWGERFHEVKIELEEPSSANRADEPDPGISKLERDDFDRVTGKFPSPGCLSGVEETGESFVVRWTKTRTEKALEGGIIVLEKTSFDEWFERSTRGLVAAEPVTGATYVLNAPPTGLLFAEPASPDSWKALWYVPEAREYHTAVWTGTEMIVWGGGGDGSLNTGGRYSPSSDTWTATSTGANCPSARGGHTAVWTGTEMIVWGGYWDADDLYTGGRYTPSSDTWVATSTGANCPSARSHHTAVWTGTEMIVWGGGAGTSYQNTGGRYTPSSDTWTATSTVGKCPSARIFHTAVWTGTEMIVWGGHGDSNLDTGGRYAPSSDRWTATSTGIGCPSARELHTAVWAGTKMIVWGGSEDGGVPLNSGSRYSPATDTWASTSTGANCPDPRPGSASVWTGAEMVIWGGSYLNTGGRYNPTTNIWISTSTGTSCPSARSGHTAVWTGTEMIVWGGYSGPSHLDTGGRFLPSRNSWVATSTGANVPTERYAHTAVWTGAEMIVWGGRKDDDRYLNTGGRYTPSSDNWTTTSTGANCPGARYDHSAVWTGAEMIVWGGYGSINENTGGRYSPSADTWTTTSTGTSCPSRRSYHTAVWTGTEMIIWGGNSADSPGGRYSPSSDTWTATSTGANCPTGRYDHTAVWTGTEMIVWGGGGNGYSFLNTGGRYTPSSDTWKATSIDTSCPSARRNHTAVWTGTEMIVWGGTGGSYLNTGNRYSASSDTWTATSTGSNCPSGRYDHTAVWTGTEMIVWGGRYSLSNTGARYSPLSNTWVATSTAAACPSARYDHSAVWTGAEMIVWDGYPRTRSGGIFFPNTPPRASPALVTSIGRDATYLLGAAETTQLDGSASTDGSNPSTSTPNHDELDSLVLYEWDLNGDASLGTACATSSTGVDRTGVTPASLSQADLAALGIGTVGIHPIWLRVTDEVGERSCSSVDLLVRSVPCTAASSLTNNTAADVSDCEDTGVRITWSQDPGNWKDEGVGTRTYDVLRDGVPVATGLTYPTTVFVDTTGLNAVAYVYSVRYVNGCGLGAVTPGFVASDSVVGIPGAASITGILDASTCTQTGIRVSFSPGPGATSHDLLRDGLPVVIGYISGAIYDPGDTASHAYKVRAINGACSTDSAPQSASDQVETPVPTVTGPSPACASASLGTQTFSLYQWFQDGSLISGATSQSYSAVAPGSYTVRVTNANGCEGASAAFVVNANPAPSISGSSTGCTSVSLSTGAFSSYQWVKDGADVGGATSQTYDATASGTYTVRVTNAQGCTGTSTGKAVTIGVSPSPTVTGPQLNSCPSTSVQIQTGTYAAYQWFLGGLPIPRATSQTYEATVSGNYKVRVTDGAGCTAESSAHSVFVDFCSTSEVSPDNAVFPLRLVEDPASSTGYYLYFQKLDSTTGYNGYIGTNGDWYSHGGMGVGRVCGQTTVDLGTGLLRAEIVPPAGDRYFLVTAIDATSEGPSGFDTNGLEVPSSLSTCSP